MRQIIKLEVSYRKLLKILLLSFVISLLIIVILLALSFITCYIIRVNLNPYNMSLVSILITIIVLLSTLIVFNNRIKKSSDKSINNSYKITWLVLLIVYSVLSIFPIRYIINNPIIFIKQINETELGMLKDSVLVFRDGDTIPLNETGNINLGNSHSWQTLESKAVGFKVEFPNIKIVTERRVFLIRDKEKVFNYYIVTTKNVKDYNIGYSVDYSIWPEIKTNYDVKDLFKMQRDFIISASNAKLESEELINSKEYFGCQFFFSIPSANSKLTYRLYFKSGILYKLFVLTSNDRLCNESIYRFLDSFKILK